MSLGLALPATGPQPTLRRRASDLLYTRRGLLLLALLAPPLLWFGVVYVGALLTLLASAFFSLDDVTGQLERIAEAVRELHFATGPRPRAFGVLPTLSEATT